MLELLRSGRRDMGHALVRIFRTADLDGPGGGAAFDSFRFEDGRQEEANSDALLLEPPRWTIDMVSGNRLETRSVTNQFKLITNQPYLQTPLLFCTCTYPALFNEVKE